MHVENVNKRIKELLNEKNTYGKKRFKSGDISMIFYDFQGAFDNVDHDILLKKLEQQYEINEEDMNLLRWYLNGTHMTYEGVRINQNKGTPQGGIISPILWLAYMNDLV